MTLPPPRARRASAAGFTLVEVLITMSIMSMVLTATMSTFFLGYRMMYKDSQRLATNASLRYFVSQVSKETLDASEFYIFEDYRALDGSVDLAADVTDYTTTVNGVDVYHGDCLVLVTRVNLETNAPVRQFRIYYRVCKLEDVSYIAPIRYYESKDFGATGATDSLTTLLNAVNLKDTTTNYVKNTDTTTISSTSSYAATGATNRQLADRTRGRPATANPSTIYPVFSSEFPSLTKTNENVSINIEIINGNKTTNLLSSSSFNYTISPRR